MRRFLIGVSFVFALLLVSSVHPVFAQEGGSGEVGSATVAKKKPLPPGFQRVSGAPDTAKVDASKLVVGAYAFFFIALFGYVVLVAKKQSEMAKEMMEIRNRLDKVGEG